MSNFPIICAVFIGMVTGASLLAVGFWVGFKVSYDIRNARNADEVQGGLFEPTSDPPEFELLDKQQAMEKKE